jgi:NAD-dependent deacetylase
MLNPSTIEAAFKAAETAEVFLSIGTSALVHPAASLPVTAQRRGATLIEINPEQTPLTPSADLYFPTSSGKLLPDLVKRLKTMTTSQ